MKGLGMLKRKKEEKPAEPQKSPAEIEAERAIARGERIKKLSDEARMWRLFASGCKAGRAVYEDARVAIYCRESEPRLFATMDEDTALLWAAFANQMAAERERRLKDVLGV